MMLEVWGRDNGHAKWRRRAGFLAAEHQRNSHPAADFTAHSDLDKIDFADLQYNGRDLVLIMLDRRLHGGGE